MAKAKIKAVQLAIGQWEGRESRVKSYSIIALGSDGLVYRYHAGLDAWAVLPPLNQTCEPASRNEVEPPDIYG